MQVMHYCPTNIPTKKNFLCTICMQVMRLNAHIKSNRSSNLKEEKEKLLKKAAVTAPRIDNGTHITIFTVMELSCKVQSGDDAPLG